jgi:NAD(P)-dependent dehydrogenase (short-subunit alcohol dehydrogenase family)
MTRTRWTAADLPDLSGRTAVVTGASSGIGLITARELARAGATVVVGVRDIVKGEAAAAAMPGRTHVRHLDLASLTSVREFAASWQGALDILINNAGIMLVPEGRTEDGFERHLGTNYLGPFVLTTLLLPHITGRVVSISSQLHKRGKIHLDDLNGDHRRYNALQAYRDSKLATILFTTELQRRLDDAGSTTRALTAHPGIARTNLTEHVSGVTGWLSARFQQIFNDPEHGALPTLYAATHDVPGGSYIGPDAVGHFRGYPEIHQPGRAARNPDLARRLWNAASTLTNTTTSGMR